MKTKQAIESGFLGLILATTLLVTLMAGSAQAGRDVGGREGNGKRSEQPALSKKTMKVAEKADTGREGNGKRNIEGSKGSDGNREIDGEV